MFPRALTVEDICNKLRPIYGDKIDKIYFRYSVAEGREEKEDIMHFLNTLYQKNLSQLLDKAVLLEPPIKELMDGNYPIAQVSYAKRQLYSFNLRDRDFPRHICITGMSGSGKTTLAFSIIEALRKNSKPFLIFDWKKSFRPLIREDSSLMLFTVGDDKVTNDFKININRPPKGVSPKEWINVLSDLLTECFSASFGVHKVILETLDEAFKEWGIYNGSDNYPTWNHIKWRLEEKFEKHQGRESGWIESALRVATVLTFGDFGKVVNYKGENSISIENLLDKKVILELNALGGIEKTFFSDFVLTYLYKFKKARQNIANHGFDHCIIVDEAHNIFLKKPATFSNETVTDMIYREMREYGTSLICLDQHVSKISDTVKGNSACHIAFQQQLPADINDISDLMLLREQKNYFSQLPVGHAIVKLSERYTSPFLIEVPNSLVRNFDVSDSEIISRIKVLGLGKDFEDNIDPQFNKEIVDVRPMQKEAANIKKEEINVENNKTLEILQNFVLEQLSKGIELQDIEKILEESKYQGGYTSNEIIRVINKVFENQRVVTLKNAKNHSISAPIDSEIGPESDKERFIRFLKENPTHVLSTVQVYQELNLSSRKGNEIKKQLTSEGRLTVQEVKYDKGWKKFVRLIN